MFSLYYVEKKCFFQWLLIEFSKDLEGMTLFFIDPVYFETAIVFKNPKRTQKLITTNILLILIMSLRN